MNSNAREASKSSQNVGIIERERLYRHSGEGGQVKGILRKPYRKPFHGLLLIVKHTLSSPGFLWRDRVVRTSANSKAKYFRRSRQTSGKANDLAGMQKCQPKLGPEVGSLVYSFDLWVDARQANVLV
jgi:hypothetical protein